MAWIKTVSPKESDEVRDAMMAQRPLYPAAYAGSPESAQRLPQAVLDESIVSSHSLIPDALKHAFSTFGVLMNPDLPLSRREHELIAATVSSLNACFY
jgi:alkylhydroperoxidase family enzyme